MRATPPAPGTSRGTRAWVASALAHGSIGLAVVIAAHPRAHAASSAVPAVEVEVEPQAFFAPAPPSRSVEREFTERSSVKTAPSPAAPAHGASVAINPPSSSAPAAPVAYASAPAPAAAPPTFVMALPSFTMGSGTSSGSGVSAYDGAQSGAQGGASDGEVVDERGVSSPATITFQPILTYPKAARAAEIEADIPVDIVVDATGHVVEARVPKPVGFGLDEAAVDTLRRTHFHPAQRHGRSVAVRMRWTMQFRLQ